MQTPTVGRIVHFYTSELHRQHADQGTGPYAAMVTNVHGDFCVDLAVFSGRGLVHYAESVTNFSEGEKYKEIAHGSCWVWPPMAAPLSIEEVKCAAPESTPLVQISLPTAQKIVAHLRDYNLRLIDANEDEQHEAAFAALIELEGEIANRTGT